MPSPTNQTIDIVLGPLSKKGAFDYFCIVLPTETKIREQGSRPKNLILFFVTRRKDFLANALFVLFFFHPHHGSKTKDVSGFIGNQATGASSV